MARLKFTHGYDLVWRASIVTIGAAGFAGGAADNGKDFWLWAGATTGILISTTFLTSTLPHYLYARLSLGADLSWEQAKFTSILFEPYLGKWYPMKEVANLPPERRIQHLLDAASNHPLNEFERKIQALQNRTSVPVDLLARKARELAEKNRK